MSKSGNKKSNPPSKRNLTIRVKEFGDDNTAITNMMMDPRYLRQSSSLIQDALTKGFDVLQLANGDIVCTGTRTIVHRYSWNEDNGKLARVKADAKAAKEDVLEEDYASEEA